MRFYGQSFKEDAENMYNILVQFIGTIGVGGNIISQHKIYKNDKKEYLDLKEHFQIE